RETDVFLSEKAKTTSPLLQVQLFETGQLWTDKLNALQRQLNARQQDLVRQLKAIDSAWMAIGTSEAAARSSHLPELENLYRLFSYYSRWESQVQERVFQLSV